MEKRRNIFGKKLFFASTLKELENKNNLLVHWSPFNAIVRNKDGEEIGSVSTGIVEKLLNSGKLQFIGKGSGLLGHESYYKLNLTPHKKP